MCGTFVESSDRLDDLITNSWNYCGFIGNLCLKHKILNFSNSIGSSQFYSSAQQSLSASSGGRHTAAIIPKSQVRTRGNGYISLQPRPYNTKLSSSNISYQFRNIVWISRKVLKITSLNLPNLSSIRNACFISFQDTSAFIKETMRQNRDTEYTFVIQFCNIVLLLPQIHLAVTCK